jgi:hypothetical protein
VTKIEIFTVERHTNGAINEAINEAPKEATTDDFKMCQNVKDIGKTDASEREAFYE